MNLATCYLVKGQFREAVESWENAFKLEPTWITSGNLNHEYGTTLVANGNIQRAREVFDLAIKDKALQAAGLRSAALIDMYEGKYRFAQPKLEEALVLNRAARAPLSEARNQFFLAQVFAGRGDRAGALRALEATATLLDPKTAQPWIAARVGVLFAELGALPRANAMLQVVRTTATQSAQDRALLLWIEGEVALAGGRAADAVEKLQVADKTTHTASTQASLAKAYRAAGSTARAIEAYERSVDRMKAECLLLETMPTCLAGRDELARLYAEDKQPEKARAQLDELLTLWRDADADLPLLKDATSLRKKLGG